MLDGCKLVMSSVRWSNTLSTVLVAVLTVAAAAQPLLENSTCGRIINTGRIEIRGSLDSRAGATIANERGVVTITGNARLEQPLLEGRTEFIGDTIGRAQRVPQITYRILYFGGASQKLFDTTSQRSLVCTDTLVTAHLSELVIEERYPLIARGRVHHDGDVNLDLRYGAVILQGNVEQALTGYGTMSALELDNTAGVRLNDSARVKIRHTLYLQRGELHNSPASNVVMMPSSLVIRTDSASIRDFLVSEGTYSVRYDGTSQIVTGNELPLNHSVLQSLVVRNSQGIVLDRHVTVNDSLYLEPQGKPTFIIAEPDSLQRYVITYTSSKLDPIFAHPRSEIIGSLRRTGLRGDSLPQLYTNRYTWLELRVPNAAVPASVTLRTLPKTFPPLPDGTKKVQRAFFVDATDARGASLIALPMTFGYAWLDTPLEPGTNESNGLDRSNVILQHWNGAGWRNIRSSRIPASLDSSGWAYSLADTVSVLGAFAIGYPAPVQVCFDARVLLEGAYRNGVMVTDLVRRGLVPSTPPNIYPYNRDPNRSYIQVRAFDSSIVDWVLVELRPRNPSSQDRIYRIALLRADGAIVDVDGSSRLCFDPMVDTTTYYIAIHHRNHLAIMTTEPQRLVNDDEPTQALLLTVPSAVFGGAAALKPIDYSPTTGVIFGMVAGDVNGDGSVDISDRADYDAIWNGCVQEGYLNHDTDMSGIVTTRDANKTWNNRGRTTNVPR